jgi:hypothetical protein
MSNEDLREDADLMGDDDVDAVEQDTDQPQAKKSSLPMMAAMGVGLTAILGFAGYKVMGVMSPAQPAQEQMVPASPMAQQPVAPVMPAPQVAPSPEGAAPGAPVVAAPVAPDAQAPMGAAPVAPTAVAAPVGATPVAPVGAAPTVAPEAVAPLGAGPVSAAGLEAIASLKKANEAQDKKIEDVEARIARLEARLAELSGSKPVKASQRSEEVVVDDETRAARKASAAKRLSAKKAKVKALKTKTKEREKLAAESKRRAANIVKSEEVLPSAPDVKRPAMPVGELPPAPTFEPAKPAKVEEPVRIGGLKIQAVIPGRAWISDEGGVARSYSVGDAVRSGIVIRAIDAEKGVVTTSAGSIR